MLPGPQEGNKGPHNAERGAVTLLATPIPFTPGFHQLQFREKYFLTLLQDLLNWLNRIEQIAVVASAVSPADLGVLYMDQTRVHQRLLGVVPRYSCIVDWIGRSVQEKVCP